MKKLPERFKNEGYWYEQIKRYGMNAIFSKSRDEKGDIEQCHRMYEVVIIRTRKSKVWDDGHKSEQREAMPSSSYWGVYGWSFTDYKLALQKFTSLVESSNTRKVVRRKKLLKRKRS